MTDNINNTLNEENIDMIKNFFTKFNENYKNNVNNVNDVNDVNDVNNVNNNKEECEIKLMNTTIKGTKAPIDIVNKIFENFFNNIKS